MQRYPKRLPPDGAYTHRAAGLAKLYLRVAFDVFGVFAEHFPGRLDYRPVRLGPTGLHPADTDVTASLAVAFAGCALLHCHHPGLQACLFRIGC